MKVIIIEDEKPAVEKLLSHINRYDPDIVILAELNSLHSAIKWLKTPGNQSDLIFMDIRLGDGLCFDIFDQIEINTPIIFTTAYEEYALRAFRVNSIDYLLKPIVYDGFYTAMEKLKSMRENLSETKQKVQLEQLKQAFTSMQRNYKTRFMVKVGEHIRSVTTERIGLFYAQGRDVYLVTTDGRAYIVEYRLEDLAEILEPTAFYRVSRTYIVNINAIADVVVYSSSRLKVKLTFDFEQEIIVSREKVKVFKDWFNGG